MAVSSIARVISAEVNPHRVCRLYLCRHGRTLFNMKQMVNGRIDVDVSLTFADSLQRLEQAFEGVGVDMVVSSKLRRAKHTAQFINAQQRYADGDFNEMAFGCLEGLEVSHSTCREMLPALYDRWAEGDIDYAVPGSESYRDVAHRSQAAVERIADSCSASSAKSVAVVGHLRMFSILLTHLLPSHTPADVLSVKLDNCSVSVLDVLPSQPDGEAPYSYEVLTLNHTSHLM